MKAFLMYRDRDFDPELRLPKNEAALTQDLELDTLIGAMAGDDKFLLDAIKKAVLTSVVAPETILYRQRILADCLEHSAAVRELYAVAVAAIEGERKVWAGLLGRYPEGLLRRSVEVLKLFMDLLRKLRRIADDNGGKFRSEGFARLFDMLAKELDDAYLGVVADHLDRLAFRSGVLMSAGLDKGNKGANYVLRKLPGPRSWVERVRSSLERVLGAERSSYVVQIADRDENGFRALSELRDRGISLVASALGQSTDHILSFFRMLRWELAFYIGCLNLRERLAEKGEPVCFPQPVPAGKPAFSATGLYDICLSLSVKERVVDNDVNADDRLLVMITGANRGGKSTFLRGVGLAQLMMQCGMFVPAQTFRANVCTGIFTHYRREEDAAMRSGKLDEELGRMSFLVDHVTRNSIVLCNESFSSTNEREGSEIARQIVRALVESGVKVFYVTHMFDLAHGFFREKAGAFLFLRAERLADGRRTFRLVEGEPLPTSHGEDLYRRIFGTVSDDEKEKTRA